MRSTSGRSPYNERCAVGVLESHVFRWPAAVPATMGVAFDGPILNVLRVHK